MINADKLPSGSRYLVEHCRMDIQLGERVILYESYKAPKNGYNC